MGKKGTRDGKKVPTRKEGHRNYGMRGACVREQRRRTLPPAPNRKRKREVTRDQRDGSGSRSPLEQTGGRAGGAAQRGERGGGAAQRGERGGGGAVEVAGPEQALREEGRERPGSSMERGCKSFSELGIGDHFVDQIREKMEIVSPTAVQTATIPHFLSVRVLVS